MNMFSDRITEFFFGLEVPGNLPGRVEAINPYSNNLSAVCVKSFYSAFYNDANKRTYIIGINPGRFGGGITGIAFTDPVNLAKECGIQNDFQQKQELSSRFIYKVINRMGGTTDFFSKFFLSALYPLALIKDGKNYNYYDSSKMWKYLKPEILTTFKSQLNAGAKNNAVICLGKRNEKYLNEINKELKYFEEIITLDHPRYIMQYKSKQLENYIDEYIRALNYASEL